jgi:hypothetical protein
VAQPRLCLAAARRGFTSSAARIARTKLKLLGLELSERSDNYSAVPQPGLEEEGAA